MRVGTVRMLVEGESVGFLSILLEVSVLTWRIAYWLGL